MRTAIIICASIAGLVLCCEGDTTGGGIWLCFSALASIDEKLRSK